jgi:hypothetical protein
LLDDRRALAKSSAWRDVANSQFHQIAASELGIDSAIEESQISHPVGCPELLSDGPDVLGLEGRLGANNPARIPRAR